MSGHFPRWIRRDVASEVYGGRVAALWAALGRDAMSCGTQDRPQVTPPVAGTVRAPKGGPVGGSGYDGQQRVQRG